MPIDTSVAVTPGVGAAIAVESIGGLSYQKIRVAWGSEGFVDELTQVAINCAGNGDNTIVAAVAAQTIRVYGFVFFVAGVVNAKWKNGAGTDFHPALPFLGNGASWMLPRDGKPWLTCSTNTALILNLSGAIQVSGSLYYAQS